MSSAAAVQRANSRDAVPAPRRYRSPKDGIWHVQLTQGETFVTGAADEVLTTVLGSCVAACIRDPAAGVGGMNHFLLPAREGSDSDSLCYGVNAMELLINGLMQRGGSRARMEAKLFGGANIMAALPEIGARNCEFARRFLSEEGIRVVGGDLGGDYPRRIEYWPLTGRARQLAVTDHVEDLTQKELTRAKIPSGDGGSDVEFF
jgi:chemotaxis protein CheD